MKRVLTLVAIGANLPGPAGSPLATCQAAAAALDGLPGLRLRALSRWWQTAPVPASDQPDYVNGVAMLWGGDTPEAVLGMLHAVEARHGRERGAVNGARTLDLDLLAWGDVVRDAAPVLPHPRLQDREFVLRPLCDVMAGWRHPVSGRTAREMLAALPAPPEARPL
jgi:2-amino-4-hydroxy-6-hydroxymethyldihydropteridine diphosphokinase